MSSSSPPLKRRRIVQSSPGLSKPFKSPLKKPLQPKQPNQLTTPTTDPVQAKPHPLKEASDAYSSPDHKISNSASKPLTPASPLNDSPHKSYQTQLSTLQKQHTALLTRLSAVRSKLETSTQALQIERSPRDAQLQDLIIIWRSASRAAAEEVFKGAKDRVNRMGGVKGLKDRERERKERDRENAWGWDGDAGDGGGEGEEAKEGALGREEWEVEERNENEEGQEEEDDVDEDGGYTMDMMLKSLNVELGVIGFDKDAQRWID